MSAGDPLRVYLVSTLPPPHGGISVWTQWFLEQAPAHGIEPVFHRVGPRSESEILRLRSRITRAGRGLLVPQWEIVAGRGARCDVVHATASGGASAWRGVALARTAWHRGRAAVLHLHSSIETCSPLVRDAIASLARLPGIRIVTPSHEDAAAWSHLTLVDNFVPEDFSRGARWKGPSEGHGLRVVYMGWMIKEKGLFELAEAVSRTPGVSVDCYGPDVRPADREALETEWRALGITDRMRFMGTARHEEVPAVLARYDALVLPSHGESFGLVTAEAMSIGLPVIGTRVGFLWDLDDALFFPIRTRDPEDLARALAEARDEKQKLRTRSETARAWVSKEIAAAPVLENWKRLFEEIVDERTRRP